VAVPLVATVAVSVIEGVERPYPGVALGSAVLLVAEWAFILSVFWVLVLIIARKALAGRLPHERMPPAKAKPPTSGPKSSAPYPPSITPAERGGPAEIGRGDDQL
jgi:hypothetical protein